MTNTELTLDQLQAVAGGATAIEYGLIATAVPKENTGEVRMECKVPPSLAKPQDRLDFRLINPDSYQSHQK